MYIVGHAITVLKEVFKGHGSWICFYIYVFLGTDYANA